MHQLLSIVPAVIASVAYGSFSVTEAGASVSVVGPDWRLEVQALTRPVGLSLAATANDSSADAHGIWAEYESANCTDAPVMVIASVCTFQAYADDGCMFLGDSGSSSEEPEDAVLGAVAYCAADVASTLDELYGDQAYIRLDYFADSNCSERRSTNAFVADEVCHNMEIVDSDTAERGIASKIATVWDNGTASMSWFNGSDCTGETTFTITFTHEQLTSLECQSSIIGYASASATATTDGTSDNGGLSSGAIAGSVVGIVAALGLAVWFVVWRRRQNRQPVDTSAAAIQVPDAADQDASPYQSAP